MLKTNPILTRYLYSTARRNGFFWLLTLYLVGLSLLVGLFSFTIIGLSNIPYWSEDMEMTISMTDLFNQGRALFYFSSILLMLTAIYLIPISALGTIAGERENRTLDLLRTTTLRPREIVLGKLLSTLLSGSLYMLAPLPLMMGMFWIGGVSVIELGLTFWMLLLTVVGSLCWGVFLSSLMRKSIAAVVLYYGVNIVGFPIASMVAGIFVSMLSATGSSELANFPLWFQAVLQYGWVILVGIHPLSASITTASLGYERSSWLFLEFDLTRYSTVGTTTVGTVYLPSPWITFTVVSIILSALLLWLAVRRLGKAER